jgi:hypothetical protein
VVSFVRFHERGFMVPASRFMRALNHHYGVELHNFAPNVISQAATFVGVCEGFLGIPVNWDIWVHLFRVELHTPAACRSPCGPSQGRLHPLHDDVQQRGLGAGMVLPPQRRARPPPYTGLVLRERPASWYHGVSPSQHQAWLESLLASLRNLAGRGLNAEVVLAHLHHRRIVPLMERPLRIFKMTEEADPVVLARSRTLPTPLLRDYAATWARRAIDPNSGRYNANALWDLEMLPTGQLVSGVLDFVPVLSVLRVFDAFRCFVCSW